LGFGLAPSGCFTSLWAAHQQTNFADSYADAGMFGNLTPASEDPYGDPADEETA
jgi:hypothetical protein